MGQRHEDSLLESVYIDFITNMYAGDVCEPKPGDPKPMKGTSQDRTGDFTD